MGELWSEVAGRSGVWLAALAGLTVKAGLILAVTAVIAFALRRRSAALRHQVWLVGVGAALMLPVLALVLPSIRVAAPWWPSPGQARAAAGLSVVEVPSLRGPVAVYEAPSELARLEARLAEVQAEVERAAGQADWRVDAALAQAQSAVERATERLHANGARSLAMAERQLAAAERALAVLERDRARTEARAGARAGAAAVAAGPVARAGRARGGVRVVPAVRSARAVVVEPATPLPPVPPLPAVAPLPPRPSPSPMAYPTPEPGGYAVSIAVPQWDAPHFSGVPGMFPPPGGRGWNGGFPWGALLLGVWLLGVWFVTAGLVIGALRVAWLGWQATPFGEGRVTTLARAIADELGLGEVRVLRGSPTAMPMTWGLRRASVLVPAGAEAWPVDQLDAVLRHELAHARRRDTLTQLFADIACAIYWFNPFVWLAAYRLRIEREHACDDEVLASGSKPSDYATQLLDMTRALRAARLTAMASIPMARPSQLRDRLEAVLDEDRTRGRVTRSVALRTWAGATLLALPLAMLGFTPAGSFADEPGWSDVAYADAVGAEVRAAIESQRGMAEAVEALRHRIGGLNEAAAVWSSGQPCRAGDGGSLSINRNDDRQEITWRNGDCRGEIRIEGDVEFSEDFRRIVGLAAGAEVRIEDEDGRTRRVLEIRPGRGGLEYDYAENGRTRAFDEDAQAWLDDMVLQLMRMGYMAEERVAWLLSSGGVEAVIQELPYLRAGYAMRLYYTAALVSEEVAPAQAAALVEAAGREIESDHDLAELLIATANARSVGAELRNAFIAAASSIESDYDLRRVLEVVLARADLSPADVAAMLSLAHSIESDHDRAELLIGLAGRYVTSPELRARYLEAAAGIGSDHDKRRVLESVLGDGALSADEAATVLELAQTIGSDHDRAELLTGLSDDALDEPALQRSYIESAAGIGSDHDQRRVLDALLERAQLADEQLALLLEAATGIGSDYDKAELLLHVADTQSLSDRNHDLFLGLLETVGSDHDHGRVASALLRARR